MFDQYNEEIVTTKSGAVDIEYYKQEASRVRSEFLFQLCKSAFRFVKGLFVSQKDMGESAANMFKVEKLAG